ncbi:hypothetical protein E4T50_11492 [Aureobasidium sp. EXF-12298]|nr:hypothetical protein E4T50_11492 [Aureobasidium sp. EXF-12298]KAI4756866.1 hypothetical protein E4T51_10070 [Aureobasidium sp. EXF-12344]KAI4773844.1 hypothetical protein E4T52_11177 [Aureobasidium sp. EXF-3400]
MSASPVNNSSNGAAAPTSVNEARDPSGFLSEIIGAPVTVKLNSGVVYRARASRAEETETKERNGREDTFADLGVMEQSVDGYMNIALEQTNEIVDGKARRNYGDAFVRGNNGMRLARFAPA